MSRKSVAIHTNGLLRQYMPKDTDLKVSNQEDLNSIVLSLNTRPRKIYGFKAPFGNLRSAFNESAKSN